MRLPEETASHPTGGVNSSSMLGDQRPGQTVLMNHTERRKNPRTPIRRLAYVNLEPYDNGGVITDISAEGLRFHMVNPVEHGGLVRLSVLLGAAKQLQIVGELIWMDTSRKIGGVRFTVLPDGAADQILKWAEAANIADTFKPGTRRRNDEISRPSVPTPETLQPEVPAARNTASEAPVPNLLGSLPKPPQTGPEPNTGTAWVPPPVRPPAGKPPAQVHSQDLPDPRTWRIPPVSQPSTAIPPSMPWITHFDPDPPGREWSFVRGVLGGFLLCALLGGAGWFALRHSGWQSGVTRFSPPLASTPAATGPLASRPDLPVSPSAELPNAASASSPRLPDEGQAAFPADSSVAVPNALSPNARLSTGAGAPNSSAPRADSAVPEASAPPRSPSPQVPNSGFALATSLSAESTSAPEVQSAKTPATQTPRPSDSGESQLMLARQYLDGRVQPRNPTVASQLLWSAVEKGNSAAEMDLADLYLHGDGVARNCDQARVLLSVASEKGNTEAMQKLHELNRTGCR